MSNNVDMLNGLGFADFEVKECMQKKGLLSIELEFTKKCNLKCLYCYSSAGAACQDELRLEEIKAVIDQAKELGAKKIVLLGGGEPLLYEGLLAVIEYIRSLRLEQVLFTNGTLMSEDFAEFFLENRVSVVIKSNSMNPEVQDMLAGVSGSFKNIHKGLERLMEAGYPDGRTLLGIQTVICRQNLTELPSMWIWARERGIVPYFEMLTHQGRAKENTYLSISVSEAREVFACLEAIDRERFGIAWKSRPTIAAFSCKRHLYSCLVNSQGYIQPCTGVDIHVGNIREKPLKHILKESSVICSLRNIYENIEGYCGSCEYRYDCYGCRGNAYQITGNYLASDPTCWLGRG